MTAISEKNIIFPQINYQEKSPSTSNGTEMILFGPMELYRFELLNKKQYRKFHFHGIMELAFSYICIINAFFIVSKEPVDVKQNGKPNCLTNKNIRI